MKILLFTLNASHSHHAPAVRGLKKALRRGGFSADFAEANLKDRRHRVLAGLAESDADVFGFSCYIWNIREMLSLAEDLKALRPDCTLLLGGPEVSFDEARFTSLPYVDCVLTGEGEESILAAARLLAEGLPLPPVMRGAPFGDFTAPGIVYEGEDDLTGLLYYESSRGCPFSCAFCLSSATEGVRAKTAETTLSDLLAFERFPAPVTVKLVDRTFNFDRERAKAIWRGLLDDRYTKCYHFEIAAHLLDEECFAILESFPRGKVRLEIGLQSTNEKTLAAIARHADAKKILTAARRLTEMGNIHVHLDLIAGLPHEDIASFERSFDDAYFCCDVLQLGFLKLLHGTRLRAVAPDFGAVCEALPPYTVLKTDVLSLADTEVLHAVSDLCERMRESGRFTHTLSLLLPRFFSPFAFYRGLGAYIKEKSGTELQKVPQRELYLLVSQFAKANTPHTAHEEISAALQADFAATEVRRAPRGL